VAAGISLRELARSVHYSKGHLSKIENGVKNPSPTLAKSCDSALEAGGTLAALVPGQRRSATPPARSGRVWADEWLLRLKPDGTSGFKAVRANAASDPAEANLVGPYTRLGSGSSSPAASAPSREEALESFLGTFDLLKALGQSTGPSVVLPTLIAQTHAVHALARRTSSGSVARRLVMLAAHFAQHTGWMTQEAGDDAAAVWWTDQAAAMAASVGDTNLSTYALVRRALIALYRDDATATVGLAREAQATPAASGRIRGLACLREAQGHALAGDHRSCERAIDAAVWMFDSGAPADDGEPVVGTANVPDLATMVRGWCLAELGRSRDAVAILDREVVKIGATAHRTRARFGARRALAHAANGDVDQACALVPGILDAANLVDSATIRLDLRNLRRTLTRWPAYAPVREVLPVLTSALHVPAPGDIGRRRNLRR
jgi:hypothetical protein